jgi:glutathione peroxidase
LKIDYATNVRGIDDIETNLEKFRGEALLIVNTASRCGFTPQYRGLETLYQRWHARGFSILGFPCNQFGRQEPGSEYTIANFCAEHYAITFTMFSKVKVNGPDTHPLYRQLKRARRGLLGTSRIQWNFNKFLVARDGTVLARYGSNRRPEDLEHDIEKALEHINPSLLNVRSGL